MPGENQLIQGRFMTLIYTLNLLAHIDRKQGGKGIGVVQLKRAQDKRDMRAFDAINKGSAFGKGW